MAGETLNFVLPLDLRAEALKYAREHDLSLAQLVRLALREFLKEKKAEL